MEEGPIFQPSEIGRCSTQTAPENFLQGKTLSENLSGKSSKELKELAQQLIAHSQQLESEEQSSPTTSVGSVNHGPSNQFQDAQDPYSGYDLDKI